MQTKPVEMAKKSITIQSIDEELYQQFKAESSRRGYKLSEFVEEIFRHIVAGEIFSGVEEQKNNSKCDDLQGKLSILQREYNFICRSKDDLVAENKELKGMLDGANHDKQTLQQEKTALQKELRDLRDSCIEDNRQDPIRGIVVEMPELETKLINYVCDKESKRVGRDVSPALLLQTMFTNFAFHGDTWFFPIPKKSEIRRLQVEIDAEKAAEGKEDAGA